MSRGILLSCLLWAPLAAGPSDAREHSLPVDLIPQEQPLWCWAACGEMVLKALGTPVSQCELADIRLWGKVGPPCPCDACLLPTGRCNTPGWPDLEMKGWSSRRTGCAPLSWRTLRRELRDGPVIFTHRHNHIGHMYVAYGHASGLGRRLVLSRDPLGMSTCVGQTRIWTYQAYREGPFWTHWHDFYRFETLGREDPRRTSDGPDCPRPLDRPPPDLRGGPRLPSADVALEDAKAFVRILSPATLGEIGFSPPVAPGSLQPIGSHRTFTLGLDEMRRLRSDPRTADAFAPEGLIQVIAQGGKPACMMRLVRDHDDAPWRTAWMGSREPAERIAILEARIRAAGTAAGLDSDCAVEPPPPAEPPDFRLVMVPEIGRYYLLYQDQGGLPWFVEITNRDDEPACGPARILEQIEAAAGGDAAPAPG